MKDKLLLGAKSRYRSLFSWLTLVHLITLVACSPPSSIGDYPFGTWKADPGYTITVNRNNTYRICSFDKCEYGISKYYPNVKMIDLYGFCEANNEIGKAMVSEVGGSSREDSDRELCDQKIFQLYENGDAGLQFSKCEKRPCLILDFDDYTRRRNISYYGN